MKKVILIASILSFFLISCKNDPLLEQAPSCIQDDIKNALNDSPRGASLTEYIYNGESVYAFDPGLGYADWLYTVVNEDCDVICEFGGFAGLNTCPDFSENSELIGVIWKDER